MAVKLQLLSFVVAPARTIAALANFGILALQLMLIGRSRRGRQARNGNGRLVLFAS
jgi:hypothetical protein